MKFTFSKPALPDSGVAVVTAFDEAALSSSAKAIDEACSGALSRLIAAERFKGKKGQTLSLPYPAGTGLDKVVVLGLGKADALDALKAQQAGGALYGALATGKDATVVIDDADGASMSAPAIAANLAYGLRLRAYRFDRYLTKLEDEDKPQLKAVKVHVDAAAKARGMYGDFDSVAGGVFLTRDLVSEPANIIYPESLAEQAKALKDLGVNVEVLGEKEMRKLGMGALLAVGQGSVRDSQLVVMQWAGASGDDDGAKPKSKGKSKKDKAALLKDPIAFVGKGVCFDSGGISIKPSAGMEDMKWDMGGAGVVIGLMRALAARKAKVDAVGIVGLVENMPSGSAQRPGDVVTSMSGQTIEVLNTDAEGRLVLSDAMWYCQDRFKPKAMIDLATLTGAILVALGTDRAGVFSNNDELAGRLSDAGEAVGEPVWRLPLGEEYDKMLKSDIADMKNIGGRYAGSITAAQFLQRFLKDKDLAWAHIDIAGVTWAKSDSALWPKGGTGFGVRLLDRLVADHYES